MLDNRYALLFVRGERPMVDEKYNLLRHPNIARTPDGKGQPFSHDGLDRLPDDVLFDPGRPEDFILLDGDEFAEMLLSPDGIPEEELEPEPIDFEPYGGKQ